MPGLWERLNETAPEYLALGIRTRDYVFVGMFAGVGLIIIGFMFLLSVVL